MSDPNAADSSRSPETGVPSGQGDRGPSGRPVLGAILLGVGALFAMNQLGLAVTDRWWTVFILVPAAAALVWSIRFYRAAGGWTPPVVGALVGGGLLSLLWAKLFFGGMWHAGAAAVPGAAWHGMAWHGAFFGGHVFLPVILLTVLVVFLLRRRNWQR